MNTVNALRVDGMTCGHCQKAVEDILKKTPGVTEVHVQLKPGLATFQGDVEMHKLILAIEEEGYKATIEPIETSKE